MKCFNCGEDVLIIREVVNCEVASCRKKIDIAVDNEEINYGILCPQHQNQLVLVREKLNQWEELIKNKQVYD